MTEHSLKLEVNEALTCSKCHKKIVAPEVVQLVSAPTNDELIAETLCQKCSDKRGE